MKKQLIFKDQLHIKERIDEQKKGLEMLQMVMQELSGLTPDLSLGDLITLVRNINLHQSFFEDFIKEKLLEKMGDHHFNGVAIKKEKLLEMVEIPNFEVLKQKIYNSNVFNRLDHNLFLINDGVVCLKDDFKEKIEEAGTYYTSTNRGNEVLSALNNVSKNLQELMKVLQPNETKFNSIGNVKGLEFKDGVYDINLNFVLDQERNG